MKTDALGAMSARVTGGFWGRWRETMRKSTVKAVYDRFEETGRFAALRCEKNAERPPHIFWDSDTAKWIEGAAYLLMDARDEALEAKVDALVADMVRNQLPDGYFNSYYIVMEPDARFTKRGNHELYCLGHLIEAGVAYHEATGKRALLDLCEKYVSLVDRVFRAERSAAFRTPGHEEIELALYKLYRHTGEDKVFALMKYFVDARGTGDPSAGEDEFAIQSHLPVREQKTAEGHAVRACYLYAAMADQAWEDGDAELQNACEALFTNISQKRMYVTGAVGSSHVGEAFTVDYDLRNYQAYAETCAALALSMFARRMSRAEAKRAYADVAELALYNAALSGISLSGDAFFYENPLESSPALYAANQHYASWRDHCAPLERQKVFGCSCCPPNILRVLSSIQEYAFTQNEDALLVHQYMDCEADTRFGALRVRTLYPKDGEIELTLPAGDYALGLRLPGWAQGYALTLNGAPAEAREENGYLYLKRAWTDGDLVKLTLPMTVRLLRAHPALRDDAGRVAVARGPVVYCAEGIDNEGWLQDLAVDGETFNETWDEDMGAVRLCASGTRSVEAEDEPLYSAAAPVREVAWICLIPYFARANRGDTEMRVWMLDGRKTK